MISLDRELLADVGLSRLPANLSNMTLRAVYAALEYRIGARLGSLLTDEQLTEFDQLAEAGDDDVAWAWLQAAIPELHEVVEEEFQRVRARLEEAAAWVPVVAVAHG